ncbi:MAG: rod shape-determining protein MreC [Pseudomonadota bacterium]|jgi:rod shape-determining protein MreC
MENVQQPFFHRGPTPLARFLLAVSLALALIAADGRFGYLVHLQRAVAVIVHPLQQIALLPGWLSARVAGFFTTQSQLAVRNGVLEQQNLVNQAALLRLEALEQENARLRTLLDSRSTRPPGALFAEIVYSHRDPFTRRVIVDKGSAAGVAEGHPVVDAEGLVGQVTRVFPWSSRVTLITDKDMIVPVQVMRSGVRGVLYGTGSDGRLELRFMPFSADIQAGDRLVTSGIDGTYPAGLPVALVEEVERDAAQMFARVAARPATGVNRYRQVLILAQPAPETANPGMDDPPPAARRRAKKAG